MVYQHLSGGFNWNAFGNVLTSLGQTGASIYSSYAQLEAAKSQATTETRRMELQRQITELEARASTLLAQAQGQSSSDTLKKIAPIGAAVGATALILLAMK